MEPSVPERRPPSPARQGLASARCSARAAATAGRGRSPPSSASMHRSSAIRGRSSRTPRIIGRSGGPTSIPHWLPQCSNCSTPTTSPPSPSPTGVRTKQTSSFSASLPGRPLFDDYVGQNREHAQVAPDWASGAEHELDRLPEMPGFTSVRSARGPRCWPSSRPLRDRLNGQVQTFVQRSPRYLGTMCEVLRHDASKWTAILHLAQLWDVDPAEICAVGDDVNDVPMIKNAGLGVAMGHAPAPVLAAADLVTGDHDQDGVAMLVDEVLLSVMATAQTLLKETALLSEHDATSRSDGPSWVRVGGGRHDQTIEENWLFRLRKERFQSRQSGKIHDFYVVHLADAVHVVALTPDDEVLLVRQFRAGSGRDSLEIPGGLVDPGEDPCAAGARELLEETGYAGDPPEFLGTLWSNPSLLTSRISTIVIRNARPGRRA